MASGEEIVPECKGPILHVIVVGFHHKKGCQVEYSFPPLIEGSPPDANTCPDGWKYLPTLALPDGSHNFDEDTVYFHLPSLTNPKETLYGISCFRQIPVEKLKNRTSDMTRGTVQKSVCVLSTVPLFGHIQVKMSLITHAYFEEGDFTKVKLLHDTYHHLNSCLSEIESIQNVQLYHGLSVRDLILQFRHKALLLFKLLLLERRLVFYRSPVQPLCATILSLLSLHPGMIELGLKESACVRPSRPMSPIPDFYESSEPSNESVKSQEHQTENCVDMNISEELIENNLVTNEICNTLTKDTDEVSKNIFDSDTNVNESAAVNRIDVSDSNLSENEIVECKINEKNAVKNFSADQTQISKTSVSKMAVSEVDVCDESVDEKAAEDNLRNEKLVSEMIEGDTLNSQHFGESSWEEVQDRKLPASDSLGSLLQRDPNFDTPSSATTTMTAVAQLDAGQCGVPLPVFTQGYLCHPYLSLPYLDLLSDVNVRGYVVGATNVLFKQKKQLADVLVEVESARVETQEPELRRQLHLTTEDLRFADFVVRQVSEYTHDVFLDGVGWEGGDEWIRAQFKAYLLCLLRTSLLPDGSRELEHYNASFMNAWKATHNYKMWISGDHNGIYDVNPGHPFAGQLSVSDMKLRLSHTMQNTEGGRKLNQAMASTGRAVATTGRAVGGALSHARGALSNWWSTLTTTQTGIGVMSLEGPVEEGEACDNTLHTPGSATDMHRSPTVEQQSVN